MPLLYALCDDLGLHGPRFGCGLNQCGAYTAHFEGKAIPPCVTPVSSWASYPILTSPDVPEIAIDLIDWPTAASWGAGEPPAP